MISRTLDLNKYRHSFFLFGPRQVGKTYLIKQTLKPNLFINLLQHQEFIRYAKNPSLLSQEVTAIKSDKIQVVIDEIQKCPELLNETQSILDDNPNVQFILTGSSARKLRRSGVNLLGGRALTLHLHPLTHEELKNSFDLDKALCFGTIPSIVLEQNLDEKIKMLKGYVETYLKEEVQQEALTRNIPAFVKFIEFAALENGNILNFQNISREVGTHSKTVKEYFTILEDTLLGFFLYPYTKSHRSKHISHPKFYLFDRGITTALRGELSRELSPGTIPYGDAFEHWVITELKRILDYREREAKLSFFRTSDGAEVDIIMEKSDELWAIEIKSSDKPTLGSIRGLRSFIRDHSYTRAICVCRTPRPFLSGGVDFLPWQSFFEQI